MNYDSANDVVVLFSHKRAGKDNEADARGLYVYDIEKSKWTTVSREPPKGTERLLGHGFYDPELNAHFRFFAGDSTGKGRILVYRFKQAARKG